MRVSIINSGRGGLGVVELGEMLGWYFIGMGLKATSVPNYGPQTRGGYVESIVVASDEDVLNPIPHSFDIANVLDILGMYAVDKVRDGGLVVINSTLIRQEVRSAGKVFYVQATRIAEEVARDKLREPRVASNSAVFGFLVRAMGGSPELMEEAIRNALSDKPAVAIQLNIDIARRAYEESSSVEGVFRIQ
ncbi:MAG: 2-oxoacid:acceptor oxidoreductase family protein [Nitrososphaeria archaeon]